MGRARVSSLLCSVFVRYSGFVGTLEHLKAMIREQAPVRIKKPLGTLAIDHGEGFPLHAGQVLEVLGCGRISWAVHFLRKRPESRVAWLCHRTSELFPMALAQEGVALSRVLFLEEVAQESGIETLLSVLRSGLFESVVFERELLPLRQMDVQLRKLQLTAEENGSLLLILSDKPTSSFGIQFQVVAEAQDQAVLRKVKGGTGR
jgi:hypothetical protein